MNGGDREPVAPFSPCSPAASSRRQSRRLGSIVFGTLANPCPDLIAVAGGQLLPPMRHSQLGGGTPIKQPYQIAAVGVLGNDHGTVLGALHHTLVAGQVEPAFFKAFSAGLVATRTPAAEDRKNVFGKADFRVSRACRSRARRHPGADDRHDRQRRCRGDEELRSSCHCNLLRYPTATRGSRIASRLGRTTARLTGSIKSEFHRRDFDPSQGGLPRLVDNDDPTGSEPI